MFPFLGENLAVVKRLPAQELPEVLNDMERKNKKGQTGLDIAVERGHTEVAATIKRTIEVGKNTSLADNNNVTLIPNSPICNECKTQ